MNNAQAGIFALRWGLKMEEMGRDRRWRTAMRRGAGATATIAVGLAGMVVALDLVGGFYKTRPHALASAAPLALIAVAYLTYKATGNPGLGETVKVLLLAAAFLLWAAYQLFPDFPAGAVLNDLAIGLFVVDVALTIGYRA